MAGASEPGSVPTKQQRIAELAKQSPHMGFTSLNHYLDAGWLLVAFLQTRSEIGAIFVDSRYGALPGTLPLNLIRVENTAGRNPDVIVSYDYDASAVIGGANGTEYSGSLLNNSYRGMHGSFSPLDVHNTLIAYGPDFREGFKDPLPTGNVDVRMEFAADEAKPATGGEVTLYVNDEQVGGGRMEHTVPVRFSGYAGMDIGRDNGMPVDRSYADKSPFAFTGTVKKVVFDVNPHPSAEHEQELHEHAHQALAGHAINA